MTAAAVLISGQRFGHQSRSRQTRTRIIEAAGDVFAAQGFHAAIGKHIADSAGVSLASINYHFGGMEGLYHAVVEAAYAHVIATDLFTEAMAGHADPEAQLLAICRAMVQAFAQEAGQDWQWRLISREATAPTAGLARAREALLVPKILMLRDLVSALVDLPADHPAVVQGCLAVMAPIVLMQVGDWTAIGRAFAGFRITPENADEVAGTFHAFTLGGLRAVAAAYREQFEPEARPS